jgi:hypothetical protein
MLHTIDRGEAMECFDAMMAANPDYTVLCLSGASKMGKTHVITRVFPTAVVRENARQATVDLRSAVLTVEDVLTIVAERLTREPTAWQRFHQAQSKSMAPVSVNILHSKLRDTSLDITNASENTPAQWDRYVTGQFIEDLALLHDRTAVLCFDNIDAATELLGQWFKDVFLTRLSALPHVRVVVTCSGTPCFPSTYADCVRVHPLLPIQDRAHFITYGRAACLNYSDGEIEVAITIARNIPGTFAEFLPLLRAARP